MAKENLGFFLCNYLNFSLYIYSQIIYDDNEEKLELTFFKDENVSADLQELTENQYLYFRNPPLIKCDNGNLQLPIVLTFHIDKEIISIIYGTNKLGDFIVHIKPLVD